MKLTLIIPLLIITAGLVQIVFFQPQPDQDTNFFKVPQATLTYKEYNTHNEQTLIMLHGSPGSKDDFTLLAPYLDEYHVIAIDMPGFGDASETKDYSIKQAAEYLHLFVEQKDIIDPIILGYSWGGGVALEYALAYPYDISTLVLYAALGIQEGEPSGSYVIEHGRYWVSTPFVVTYPGSFIWDQRRRVGFLRSFMDSDQRHFIESIQTIEVPTKVVHGTQDTVIPLWVANAHASLIPGAELHLYNGTHGTHFTNPVPGGEAIRRALQ